MAYPIPTADECEADFIDRCHKELATEVSGTDNRNAIAFAQWRESRGPGDLYRKAQAKFPDGEYVLVRDVPQFAEHITKDADGNAVKYDRAAMVAIAARNNERIDDTGDFSPLIDGHTPDRDQFAKGAKMPDVLGYVGPFRVGMIGNKNPRWAIFADEWHRKADAEKLQKLRRRSPEVWLEDRMEDRFMDPIAALGAETPRLDMGLVAYHRLANGDFVQKYSCAAAYPGPGSVFIPDDDIAKKKHSADGSSAVANMTPEDVGMIVDALEQLDWVQWVKAQMMQNQAANQQQAAPGAVPGQPAAPGMAAPAPAAPGAAPVAAAPAAPVAGSTPGAAPPGVAESEGDSDGPPGGDDDSDSDSGESGGPPDAGESDDEKKKDYAADSGGDIQGEPTVKTQAYEAGSVADSPDGTPAAGTQQGKQDLASTSTPTVGDPAVAKNSRAAGTVTREQYARLERRADNLEQRLAASEARERKAQRYSRLGDLQQSGVIFDMEAEQARVEKMDDAQFESHVGIMVDHYQRAPIGEAPLLVIHGTETKEKAADKEVYDRALAINARYHRQPKTGADGRRYIPNWDECVAEAKTTATGKTQKTA